MHKKSANGQKGFTIIEVLIVLAIGGLILLIVFLAVPALQRNSRNTQRKNDVSSLLSAMTESANNNGGSLPKNVAPGPTDTTVLLRQGTTGGTEVKLGYYDATDLTRVSISDSNRNAVTDIDSVKMVLKSRCGTDGAAAPGPSRSFVALYAVESGRNATSVCQEG
ncbi:MAG TPA: type II secretion system protein [Candidatus Saccharimonadales bacterium]|nr:type II secretion system protein [Candidatus Saccharimonadales bacterium]